MYMRYRFLQFEIMGTIRAEFCPQCLAISFVSFRFDLFRFVSICFVSFRFVSVSFRTFIQGPLVLPGSNLSLTDFYIDFFH